MCIAITTICILVVIDVLREITDLNLFYDRIGMFYISFAKFKTDVMYEGKSLKRVLDTRWSGHYDPTCAVIDNDPDISNALTLIVNSTGFDK